MSRRRTLQRPGLVRRPRSGVSASGSRALRSHVRRQGRGQSWAGSARRPQPGPPPRPHRPARSPSEASPWRDGGWFGGSAAGAGLRGGGGPAVLGGRRRSAGAAAGPPRSWEAGRLAGREAVLVLRAFALMVLAPSWCGGPGRAGHQLPRPGRTRCSRRGILQIVSCMGGASNCAPCPSRIPVDRAVLGGARIARATYDGPVSFAHGRKVLMNVDNQDRQRSCCSGRGRHG